MPSWAFALEAPGSPLGNYAKRLDRARQLDYVFDLAAAPTDGTTQNANRRCNVRSRCNDGQS
jgi:hypothetical protein